MALMSLAALIEAIPLDEPLYEYKILWESPHCCYMQRDWLFISLQLAFIIQNNIKAI